MMAEFYIHIGMHKTGTSSIQHNFYKQRNLLLARDINYLRLGHNHSVPLFSLLTKDPHRYHINVQLGINTPPKAEQHNRGIRHRLGWELRLNKSKKVVISGEDLSLLEAGEIQALKDILQPYAENFRIIVYVRSPLGFISSALQQRLKGGNRIATLRENPPLPHYRDRIEKYIATFGRSNVDIRVFDPKHFVEGDLISDFSVAIGESAQLLERRELVRMNESLCHEAALILDHANKVAPLIVDNAGNPDRTNMDKWLSNIKGPKFVLNADIPEVLRLEITDDLNWLHGVLGRKVFTLEPLTDSVASWGEDTLESIARLINTMGRLIHEREALLRVREGQLAFLANNLPDAKKKLQVAIRLNPYAAAAHYELSRVHAAAGQRDKAIDTAREALGLDPINAEYRGWLAQLEESAAAGNDRQASASAGES